MIEGIPVSVLTPSALLGLAVLFVFLGKLVPKSFYDDKKDEAETWKQAYEAEREARNLADKQNAELLELARASKNFIEGVFKNSEQIRKSGDHNVVARP